MAPVEGKVLQKGPDLLPNSSTSTATAGGKDPQSVLKRAHVECSAGSVDKPVAKRRRVKNDVFALPSSPGPDDVSTVSWSSENTSASRVVARRPTLDFEGALEIRTRTGDDYGTLVIHEHLLRPLSRHVREFWSDYDARYLGFRPYSYPLYMEPQIAQFFVHWLYHNSFGVAKTVTVNAPDLDINDIDDYQLRTKIRRIQKILPQCNVLTCKAALEERRFNFADAIVYLASTSIHDADCGFGHLLELYIFGNIHLITVLKNVVIDHLIDRASNHSIPMDCSKKIYRHTNRGDQLRRLWVDFYVWQVEEVRLQTEQHNKWLDSTFLEDLVMAQTRKIRDNSGSGTPPYQVNSAAYHERDIESGQCCCRSEFEGDEYRHRRDYLRAQEDMKNADAEVKELRRKVAELEKALSTQQDSRQSDLPGVAGPKAE